MDRITQNILDVVGRREFYGTLHIDGERLVNVEVLGDVRPNENWLVPGNVDAHIHVESILLTPPEAARLAVRLGTICMVADPHEKANVCGVDGVKWMWNAGQKVPFYFAWGAPSCVPATCSELETAGAEIGVEAFTELLKSPFTTHAAEMMNFPGVLRGDPVVLAKLEAARKAGKPCDGHAPKLRGDDLRRYAEAGIVTCHEQVDIEGARELLALGMYLIIREGSAARNYAELWPLMKEFPGRIMFGSDDLYADELAERHIDDLIRRSIRNGINRMDVFTAASLTPKLVYKLSMGLLQKGDFADFVEVNNPDDYVVLQTVIKGRVVAKREVPEDCSPDQIGSIPCISLIERVPLPPINNFACEPIAAADLEVQAEEGLLCTIQPHDGQLITSKKLVEPVTRLGLVVADAARDIQKIAVINRYQHDKTKKIRPAVAFVSNFGMNIGAIAGTVAHDCHQIVVVGMNDEDMARAVNLVIEHKGALVAVHGDRHVVLPLPYAGLMSDMGGFKVAERFRAVHEFALDLGCTLKSPFMALSFLCLLVIPDLKLSDKGLFDGKLFRFTPLFEKEEAAAE